MPTITARKRELTNAAMREHAFECSVELLKQSGWRKFTMDKLAGSMGVSKGTLYNYFRDKNDVIGFIRACIVQNVKEMVERELGATDDMRQVLRRIVDITLEKMGQYRFIAIAFLDIAMTQNVETFRRTQDFEQERMMADVLQKAMDQGVVRKGDPVLMAMTLNASIAAVELSCNLLYKYDLSLKEVREQVTDWLLNGILTEEK